MEWMQGLRAPCPACADESQRPDLIRTQNFNEYRLLHTCKKCLHVRNHPRKLLMLPQNIKKVDSIYPVMKKRSILKVQELNTILVATGLMEWWIKIWIFGLNLHWYTLKRSGEVQQWVSTTICKTRWRLCQSLRLLFSQWCWESCSGWCTNECRKVLSDCDPPCNTT